MNNWSAPINGTALLDTRYSDGEQTMLRLYSLGKQKQWDSATRINWETPVDPGNPLGMPDSFVWIAGSKLWDRLPHKERRTLRQHTAAWSISQLLHGEQLGLMTVAKLAAAVPHLDARLFAATQIMDEARHTEVFSRYLTTKIGITYPLTNSLSSLFQSILIDSRWDMSALAVQIMVENLALAIFTLQRDHSTEPLVRAIIAYVMQDEARHVAFGRVLLRRHYAELTTAERKEREEFVTEACWTLRDGFIGEAVWENLDYGAAECLAIAKSSPTLRQYRRRLFMRIVPALKDIDLFGPSIQDALAKMGVLGFADLEEDEFKMDDDLEVQARQEEIAAIVALGAAAGRPAEPEYR